VYAAKKYAEKLQPAITPAAKGVDTLTRVGDPLGRLQFAEVSAAAAVQVQLRADYLSRAYNDEKNKVLKGLYDTVKERFVSPTRNFTLMMAKRASRLY